MTKHNKPYVGYFEISADNIERSQKFYSELFGWKIEKDTKIVADGVGIEYYMISNPIDPLTPEGHPSYVGGMMKRQHPKQAITVYVDVEKIDPYLELVKKLGGTIIKSKTAVQNHGYFAVCQDTEENVFAIWENNTEAS